MPGLVRTRLSAMMFVFYFSLGGWAVTTGTYLLSAPIRGGLNFSTSQVGWIYSTFAFGGMLATPLVGLLVDRFFRAERVFAVSNFFCGVFLLIAAFWCQESFSEVDRVYRVVASEKIINGIPVLETPNWNTATEKPPLPVAAILDEINDDPRMEAATEAVFIPLFLIMLAQAFCLQIGMTLTTVITIRNLADPTQQFARVRLFGTVGWIVVGLVMGMILEPISSQPFVMAGVVSLLLGVYALTLPPTHPKAEGKSLGQMLGLPAFVLFKDRSFVIFLIVALLCSQMNQFYGVYGHRYLSDMNIKTPEKWMTLGQAVEVILMFAIPSLNPRQTMKWLMALGAFGGAIRAAAMIPGQEWLILCIGVPMHGWAYALYFAIAPTFIDMKAPHHLRASTQAIAAFVISGLAPWTGNLFAAAIVNQYRQGTVVAWDMVWWYPTVGCILATIIFVLFFRSQSGSRHQVTVIHK